MNELEIIMNRVVEIRTQLSKYLAIINHPLKNNNITEEDLENLKTFKNELPSLKSKFLLEANINNVDENSIIMFLDTIKRLETQLYEIIELNNLFV